MKDVKTAIEECNSAIVVGHINPDADCIGSLVVMTKALQDKGKDAKLILPLSSVNRKFRFLLDIIPEVCELNADDNALDLSEISCDLIIVLDTALKSRINIPDGFSLPNAPICNIDHHLGNELFGKFNLVDSQACAACQILYELLCFMGVEITAEQATLLYGGLHCDTCGFSLTGTDGRALNVAAKLAEAGANIGWVCQKLHRNLAISEFKLMQIVYKNTNMSENGDFAWSSITLDEFSSIGACPADVDEQVSVPRSIEGVKIAALFSEIKPGRIRINLRANDNINLLPLAKMLGGGGHAQAAGVITSGTISDVIEKVKSSVIEYLNNPEMM